MQFQQFVYEVEWSLPARSQRRGFAASAPGQARTRSPGGANGQGHGLAPLAAPRRKSLVCDTHIRAALA